MTAPKHQAHEEDESPRESTAGIGGPGTCLPRPVESLLSWILALTCLTVSGYHYLVSTFLSPLLQWRSSRYDATCWPCWLPLTTASRSELNRKTPMERHQQLEAYLREVTKNKEWSDEELVRVIRHDEIARRLASLAMRPTKDSLVSTTPLGQQLAKIWTALLQLPPTCTDCRFDISLIVPAYRERGMDVANKLRNALVSCQHPNKIQVIIVDAGSCPSLKEEMNSLQECWGKLEIVTFQNGGGRGPCLNFGARHASGRVYTFCHSDTTLPPKWDIKIQTALSNPSANSCAFSFGIDTTGCSYPPPGIKAVELSANIRTHLYSLPYGDQVLSVPSNVFDYVGGFPDQCLMEDYELVSLLRKRAAFGHKFAPLPDEKERLVIIPSPPALCSPRRWQQYGVLYVTYMNSKFVNLYASGLTPDGLFELYYQRPPPKRSSPLTPWEVNL